MGINKQSFLPLFLQTCHFLITHKQIVLLLITSLSALYIIFTLVDFSVILAFLICVGSFCCYLYLRWKKLKEKGMINLVSPKTKELLLNKSILDIYRDLIYFPYVTKIVGAFMKAAVTKPPPEQIHFCFEDLPENVQQVINTKGILHLAPDKVQKLFLQREIMDENDQNQKIVPQSYGKVNNQWYNIVEYEKHEIKTHQRTMGNEFLVSLNRKIGWKHVFGLAAMVIYGLMKTRGRKMGKIFLYNGSAAGVVIIIMLMLIKMKNPYYSSLLQKKNK